MTSQALDLLLKPTLTGITAVAGLYFIFSHDITSQINLPIIGNVNTLLATVVVTGALSWLKSLNKDYILPYLPGNSKYTTLENKLINPVFTGGLVSLLYYNNLADSGGFIKMFGLGAGATILASYEYDAVKPYLINS